MISRHNALTSEIAMLQRMVDDIPEDDVLERAAFEQRLIAAKKRLERAPAEAEAERTRITFRGEPVTGSLGIKADFGGRASVAFSDAFAAVVAGQADKLKFMGPIPEKARTQLTITGTVTGSFGFEFQLPNLPDEYFPSGGGPGTSLEHMYSLVRASAVAEDDDVAEIVGTLHPRAVRKVADFLELLADNQAWCALEFRQKVFRYKNVEQLRKSIARLRSENIKETREAFLGEIQGVLPRQRTFEFLDVENQNVIRGKIGAGIEDVSKLNREFLHVPVAATFSVVQVGQGRPKFFLNDIADLTESSYPSDDGSDIDF